MIKTKQPHSGEVVVDLKELEWVKVLEVTVPSDLVWLALINMAHPVQFDRLDLGLLIYCIREHAVTVKRTRERAMLERIADKMEKAVRMPPSSPRARPTASKQVPNNRQTALKVMRQFLQEQQNTPTADDPVFTEYKKAVEGLTGKPLGRPHRSVRR
jgi:hypothetical protein